MVCFVLSILLFSFLLLFLAAYKTLFESLLVVIEMNGIRAFDDGNGGSLMPQKSPLKGNQSSLVSADKLLVRRVSVANSPDASPKFKYVAYATDSQPIPVKVGSQEVTVGTNNIVCKALDDSGVGDILGTLDGIPLYYGGELISCEEGYMLDENGMDQSIQLPQIGGNTVKDLFEAYGNSQLSPIKTDTRVTTTSIGHEENMELGGMSQQSAVSSDELKCDEGELAISGEESCDSSGQTNGEGKLLICVVERSDLN